ncbi:hypothetical protein ABPG74_000269 [Tetrahymena malaccensis]
MKLYKKSEIFSEKYNKNSELEISPEVQKKIMDGNAAFIIDLIASLKIPSFTISSLGIQLVNYFFIGKSYLNYDRFIYCAAALMLAFKIKEQDHYRLKPIIMGYYQQAPRRDQTQIMNDTIYQQIKNKICIAESKLLKAIQFEFDIQLPFDFLQTIIEFCNEKDQDKERIYYATKVISYDSFRSYAPLIFKPQIIAVSAFMISCSQFNIEPHLRIPERFKQKYNPETMREEEAYERWLQEISIELKTQITAEDIKDCLYVLNELLYLHYNPKEDDVKKFEQYELSLEQSKVKNDQNEKLNQEKQADQKMDIEQQ